MIIIQTHVCIYKITLYCKKLQWGTNASIILRFFMQKSKTGDASYALQRYYLCAVILAHVAMIFVLADIKIAPICPSSVNNKSSIGRTIFKFISDHKTIWLKNHFGRSVWNNKTMKIEQIIHFHEKNRNNFRSRSNTYWYDPKDRRSSFKVTKNGGIELLSDAASLCKEWRKADPFLHAMHIYCVTEQSHA